MLIKKRGQAAMEFLMTYGWAILVVLVVIGALAYFGVLNPQSFLPKKCQFSTGLICQDHVLYENGGAKLVINNGLGNDIKVSAVSFVSDNKQVGCKTAVLGADPDGVIVATGATKTFDLTLDTNVGDGAAAKCNAAAFKGSRLKGALNLKYKNLQTGLPHEQPGTLLTDVEVGTLVAEAP